MKIKNLKINKKGIASILTAGTIAFTMTGCGNIDTSELSFDEVLSNKAVQEITALDDEQKTNEDIKESLDDITRLETAFQVLELTKYEDYSDVDKLIPLTDKEKEELLDLDMSEIKKIMNKSKKIDNDLVTLENKLIATKKMAYLNNYYRDFIHNYGLGISERALKASVKGSIASEKNCSINDIKIGKMPNRHDEEIHITIKGDKYKLKPGNKAMWNAVEYIYAIELSDQESMSDKDILETCQKALDYSKAVTLKGSNIKDDKIVEQYSNKYVKKNILK